MSLVAACGADANSSGSFEPVAISDASAPNDLSGGASGADAPSPSVDGSRGPEDTVLILDGLSSDMLPLRSYSGK